MEMTRNVEKRYSCLLCCLGVRLYVLDDCYIIIAQQDLLVIRHGRGPFSSIQTSRDFLGCRVPYHCEEIIIKNKKKSLADILTEANKEQGNLSDHIMELRFSIRSPISDADVYIHCNIRE